MTRRNLLFVSLGLAAGLALAIHWPLLAQGERKATVEGAVAPFPEGAVLCRLLGTNQPPGQRHRCKTRS